jgi:aryl-alcohol dehydrogenase-like predicted oxidoreductase
MPYGLPDVNGRLPMVSEADALSILQSAFETGINLVDTSNGYGQSEALIGRALRHWYGEDIVVATKLAVLDEAMPDAVLLKTVQQSIETSRRTLDRETIDLMQVHNATPVLMARESLRDALFYARSREWIRFQGVTTYGIEAPRYALEQGCWDTVQMAFNVLDQTVAPLFPALQDAGIAVMIRSALLKGALSTSPNKVPDRLRVLAEQAEKLPSMWHRPTLTPAQAALLFVYSHPAISTIITGVLTYAQLAENWAIHDQPVLTQAQLDEAQSLHVADSQLTDPRQWAEMLEK